VKIPSVGLTYQDVAQILERMQRFIDSANQGVSKESATEFFEVSGADGGLKFRNGINLAVVRRAKDTSLSLTYLLEIKDAPISQVGITLRDTFREINIGGTSEDQTESLLLLLSNDFQKHRTWWGGIYVRLIIGTAILVGVLIAVIQSRKISELVQLILVSISVIGWMLFSLGDWGIFPGTAIYSEDATWYVRNAAMIGLLGLVLSVALPICQLIFSRRPTKETFAREIPDIQSTPALANRAQNE